MLRVVVGNAVLNPPAGIARHGHVLQEIQRDGAESRWVDAVADEAARQRPRRSAIARGGCERGEIAVEHRLRGNEADGRRRVVFLDATLIPAEDEQLVPDDRRAERATELVALQAVALGREKIPRVEMVVAQEFEEI